MKLTHRDVWTLPRVLASSTRAPWHSRLPSPAARHMNDYLLKPRLDLRAEVCLLLVVSLV